MIYDKQGNIQTLFRQSGTTTVDNLVMTYSGNLMKSVIDAAWSQGLYYTKEYNDKSNTSNEQSYDQNGNMIKDLNPVEPDMSIINRKMDYYRWVPSSGICNNQ